jgi:hypothetical protein
VRNLLKYPVTQEEILESLRKQMLDIRAEGRIGDMRPLVLRHTTEILEAAFGLLKGFDRRAAERGMRFVIPFNEATALIKACDFQIKAPSVVSSTQQGGGK